MNSLRTTGNRVALALGMLGLLLVATFPSPAYADRPTTFSGRIDFTADANYLCGFPLTAHTEGLLRVAFFYDNNGQLVRQTTNWNGVRTTYTNPANGNTLIARTSEGDTFRIEREGGFTITRQGLTSMITIPGMGVVSGSAGHLVVRIFPDGNIEMQGSGLLVDGAEQVCSYLQG